MFANDFTLQIFDLFFELIHILLISFVILGAFFKKTRKFHLVALGLILFSWLGLGVYYGWGYCFLTDIHWYIKDQLGQVNLPPSYITYLFSLVGIKLTILQSNIIASVVLLLAIFFSIYFNLKDRNQKKDLY